VFLKKIRAVREDPANPMMDCYDADDLTIRAKLEVARVMASHIPTNQPPKKEESKMSLNPEYIDASAPKVQKYAIPIHYAEAPGVIRTLEALGLRPPNELRTLAASGAKVSAAGWQTTLDEVDMALAKTYADMSTRMAFKAALVRHGLMSPRRS
jgi:hypothetical protein